MHRTRLLALTAVLLWLPACVSGPGRGPDNPDRTAALVDQLGGRWMLVSIRGGPDIRPALVAAGVDNMPDLTFDAESGRIAGSGGVNRWSADLETDALTRGAFLPGPAMSTMMAGPEPAMRVEQAFLAALAQATRFDERRMRDGVLLVRDDEGSELLRFEKTP